MSLKNADVYSDIIFLFGRSKTLQLLFDFCLYMVTYSEHTIAGQNKMKNSCSLIG